MTYINTSNVPTSGYSSGINHVSGLREMCPHEKWNPEFTRLINDGTFESLYVNQLLGFAENDFEFLKDIPNLRQLWAIGSWSDDSGVSVCSNLQYLNLDVSADNKLDYSQFEDLRGLCTYGSRKPLNSFLRCPELKDLAVYNFQLEDFVEFSRLPKLVKLSIGPSRKLTSLKGLEVLANTLESLVLGPCSSLSNFELETPLTKLSEVEIYGVRKMNKLDFVANMPSLSDLKIDKCGEIESLEPLRNSQSIKRLHLIETKVLDGDMSVLDTLTNVEKVDVIGYNHYKNVPDWVTVWGSERVVKKVRSNSI